MTERQSRGYSDSSNQTSLDDSFHLTIDVGSDSEADTDLGVSFVVVRVVLDSMVVRNLLVHMVLVQVMSYVNDLGSGFGPGFVVADHQRKKGNW